FVRGVRVMELGAREVDAAQAAGAVHSRAVHVVFDRQGGAQSWPAWWIEVLHENVNVLGGLLGVDVSRRGSQPDHVDVGIEEGQGDCECAVDARVGKQDHFMRHGSRSRSRWSTTPRSVVCHYGPANILTAG